MQQFNAIMSRMTAKDYEDMMNDNWRSRVGIRILDLGHSEHSAKCAWRTK